MNLQTVKATVHELIDKINDEALLNAYLKIIESSFENNARISVEQYNQEIEEADGA